MLWKPSLLQRDVRGVARFDVIIDGEIDARNWTVPNLMIAASLSDEIATGVAQDNF